MAAVWSRATFRRSASAIHTRHGCRRFSVEGSLSLPEGLRQVSEAELAELTRDGRPVLLHCAAQWSARSRVIADRLAEWLRTGASSGISNGVVCVAADVERSPGLLAQRHVKSVPTVLLLRSGRTEVRADGSETSAMEHLLAVADTYRKAEVDSLPDPKKIFAAAEELLRGSCELIPAAPARHVGDTAASRIDHAEAHYRSLLSGAASSSAEPFAFRARLGVLRCTLLKAAPERSGELPALTAREAASAALSDLREHHGAELYSLAGQDAAKIARFVAHAELMVDAWDSGADEDARQVLQHYADGQPQAALDTALAWYKREAGGDIEGLVHAYSLPERRLSDRVGDISSESLYTREPFSSDIADAPGPAAPRAMLRRLFAALGPTHELVAKAIADLEFLLDRKRWVPFHTRQIIIRKGGRPKIGRGTGSGTGYSKRYWVAWGPGRMYKNQKPMGGPHTNKHDGWDGPHTTKHDWK